MRQALRPILRPVMTTSAVALLVAAGLIAPRLDTQYGAVKSAMAAAAATGSGGTSAAGTGAPAGAGAASRA